MLINFGDQQYLKFVQINVMKKSQDKGKEVEKEKNQATFLIKFSFSKSIWPIDQLYIVNKSYFRNL